jgi:hypothetical protein
MLRRVALVRAGVSEEFSISSIRVRRIGEIGTLTIASNRSLRCEETSVLQEPHCIAIQRTAFLIATAVKISDHT